MLKQAKKIGEKGSIVSVFFEQASKDGLMTQLSAPLVDLIDEFRHQKQIKKGFSVTPLAVSAVADQLVMIELKKGDSINVFRGLIAKANQQLRDVQTVQWVLNGDVPDEFRFHLGQVIAMTQYDVPKITNEKKPQSYPKHILIGDVSDANRGYIIGQAVNKARTFANLPANILTTQAFVDQITALFESDDRYTVRVLDEKELEQKK